jgi:hypothetical protein
VLALAAGVGAFCYVISGTSGLIDDGFEPAVATILGVALVLAVVIGLAGLTDALRGSAWARRALWAASVILLFGSAAMVMTIGWLFLPAGLLAVGAAFASWRMED